jgi:hypothetical protein
MPSDNIKKFLEKTAQIESSGGKQLNHPEIESGIHSGDSAVGQYGLMPNTIKEILNRTKEQSTPDIEALRVLPNEVVNREIASNPMLEDEVARKLAEHVLQRQLGDEEKAAYSWQYGHNLPPSRITPEILESSPRIQKWRKLSPLIIKE